MEKILVVEDKQSMAQMLKVTLEMEGYEVIIAGDGAEGIKKTVIVMTAYGTVETAVKAIKLGAFDFITKPLDTDHLLILIERSLKTQRLITENLLLKDTLSHHIGVPDIIGKSAAMVDVGTSLQKVAPTRSTVLLLGESGTGKELFARAIHDLSPSNCAAIPGELLESELFGYEKGAFTGAADRKLGKLELADKGTVFLDEVGEMDIALQSKVLRTLQEGEIDRVGGTGSVRVDIRIIAASNRDLESAVSVNKFRGDLYYRLSVFPIVIPPLRKRQEDIPALVEHFVSKYSGEMNVSHRNVSPDSMNILKSYPWKGNVRELENVIERALILCEGDAIETHHLGLKAVSAEEALGDITMDGTLEDSAKAALKIAESRRIRKALQDTNGNKTRAAELLRVSYKTLLTKIKDYRIES
jgi:DNA-binding NtrC family response regulator